MSAAGKPVPAKGPTPLPGGIGPSPARARALFLAVALVITAVTWGVHALTLEAIRASTARNLADRAASESAMLENHASRSLDSAMAVLRSASVLDDRKLLSPPPVASRMLAGLIADTPMVRSLSLVDDRGLVVASSTPRNVGVTVPRLELATADARLESGEIAFGEVFPLRDLHELTADREPVELGFWTAMRSDEIGARKYRWLAAINLGIFRNLWSELDTDESTEIQLIDASGTRIAGHHARDPSRTARAIEAVLRQSPQMPKGRFTLPGDEVVVAFQRSPTYPAILMVIGDPRLAGLATPGRFRHLEAGFAVNLALLLLLGALFLFYRRYERRTRELANYVRAIDLHLMVSRSNREGIILGGNRAFFEVNGYAADELVGQNYSVLGTEFHTPAVREAAWKILGKGKHWKGTLRNRKKTGEHYWVNVTITPFPDIWGRFDDFITLMTDVTESFELTEAVSQERRLREELANLNQELATTANTDALTGLPNRRAFDVFVEQARSISVNDGRPLSLLVIDIDHFKRINDTFGHSAGDEVLSTLARRWQRELRKSDMLARIGGEEFCVVLPRTAHAHALRIAEKLRAITAALPIELDPDSERSRELSITASVGAGTADRPAEVAASSLMATADSALYAAKSSGRNRVEGRMAD